MPAGTARVQGLLFHSLALLHCRRLVLDDRAEVRAAPRYHISKLKADL